MNFLQNFELKLSKVKYLNQKLSIFNIEKSDLIVTNYIKYLNKNIKV